MALLTSNTGLDQVGIGSYLPTLLYGNKLTDKVTAIQKWQARLHNHAEYMELFSGGYMTQAEQNAIYESEKIALQATADLRTPKPAKFQTLDEFFVHVEKVQADIEAQLQWMKRNLTSNWISLFLSGPLQEPQSKRELLEMIIKHNAWLYLTSESLSFCQKEHDHLVAEHQSRVSKPATKANAPS